MRCYVGINLVIGVGASALCTYGEGGYLTLETSLKAFQSGGSNGKEVTFKIETLRVIQNAEKDR